MYRNGKHMISTSFVCFVSFVVFHQKPMALRPSYSTAENLPEEKQRLLYPKGSWQKVSQSLNIVALQVPPISSLAWSVRRSWSLNRTDLNGAEVVHNGLRSRAMNAGTCTESTIPTRGKETQPFGLKPDIILYRNRTINIYIIMIDYIYVQLHIDIYTQLQRYIVKKD